MQQDLYELLSQFLPNTVAPMVAPHVRKHEFAKGANVYRQGEAPQGIYLIRRGLVGLVIYGEKGQEHLLRLFRPGQVFGHRSLLAEEPYHATAICLESTEALFLEASVVRNLLHDHPQLARELLKVLARELRRAEQHLVTITDKDVLGRTAQAVVYLQDLHPEHRWTRKEIADFCATTAPTVIRSLAKLEQMALIRQEGRKITILDRDALLQMSPE